MCSETQYHTRGINEKHIIWVRYILSIMPIASTFFTTWESMYRYAVPSNHKKKAQMQLLHLTWWDKKQWLQCLLWGLWISVILTPMDQRKPLPKRHFYLVCGKLGWWVVYKSLGKTDRAAFYLAPRSQPFYWFNGKRPELKFRTTICTRTALIWKSCWIQWDLKMMHDRNSSQTGALALVIAVGVGGAC